ncbi:MAG: uncharacterized protein K0S32_4534 [Bacteroidetes bacterium]|jgi:hypothetical protein|nr:uncharacterized protein [Bacteroidota bacterium]
MTFKDINLKFAIISCLNEKELYIDEAEQIKMKAYYKRSFQQLDYDDIVPEVYNYYKEVIVDDSELKLIFEFNPSASNTCYNLLVKEWSGEDDIFDMTSLDGIESLENMSVFNPLGLMDNEINITALTKCKKLSVVHSEFLPRTGHVEEILSALKANGVRVIE